MEGLLKGWDGGLMEGKVELLSVGREQEDGRWRREDRAEGRRDANEVVDRRSVRRPVSGL